MVTVNPDDTVILIKDTVELNVGELFIKVQPEIIKVELEAPKNDIP